ncbi:helix-turn-helix transcriptional regulator [Enterococcus sp. LJL120]
MFEINEVFTLRVRERRAKYRLTVSAAAKEIGISRRTLALIETNKLQKISKTVYHKTIDWLIK